MENKTTGIKWLNNTTLIEDLDFADDIALLSHSYNDQHIKTTSLSEIARQSGLLINSTKTKILETQGKDQQDDPNYASRTYASETSRHLA